MNAIQPFLLTDSFFCIQEKTKNTFLPCSIFVSYPIILITVIMTTAHHDIMCPHHNFWIIALQIALEHTPQE